MIVQVKITPGAKEDKVIGFAEGILKIKVRAPAIEGKANLALIDLLSKHFKIPKRDVIIKSGESSRLKLVILEGIDALEPFL